MIKCNDELELRVEKLTYEGSALSRCKDGYVVFIKNGAPDDLVKVKIVKANKNYALAEIIEIIEPSRNRTKPFCPLFNACGSCSYQYLDYDFLLSQKENMLKEAFSRLDYEVEFLPVQKSPKVQEYRHKIQYRVSETKNSKRLLVGYFKEKTHDITNIKFCPTQPKLADDIAQFLRDNWTLGGYIEKTHKGLLRNFVLRISSDLNSALLTLVLNLESVKYHLQEFQIKDFATKICAKFPQIKGVVLNFNPDKTNKIFSDDFKLIEGQDFIFESLKSHDDTISEYKISASSFFQVNPACAVKIFDEVKEYSKNANTFLDAYGGVGAIGIWCRNEVKKITLVEENAQAVSDAKENFKLNGVQNYEVFLGDAKEQLKKFIKEKKKFSCVVIDPPRKGSDKEALEIVSKLAEKIIYVSCNPQTLVRDINILKDFGFKAKKTRAFDMFPYSYHIESVTLIEREM